MHPSEAIYRTVYGAVSHMLGHSSTDKKLYETAPDSGAKYPFVWLDNERTPFIPNNDLMGTYTISIRLYGTLRDRGELNRMNALIHDGLKRLTSGFGYAISLRTYETNTIKENDNGTALLHLTTEASFYWNKS